MDKFLDLIVKYEHIYNYVMLVFFAVVGLLIGKWLVEKIRESDSTYKEIIAIEKGLSFTDINALYEDKKKKSVLSRYNLTKKIYTKMKKKLLYVEEDREFVILFFIAIQYVLPIVILLNIVLTRFDNVLMKVILLAVVVILPEANFRSKKKEHIMKFQHHAYKIFTFVNNLRSSGVPTQKIINRLHYSVDDNKLKKKLISFSAAYIATNNFNESISKHITNYYDSIDALALENALAQGLSIGDQFTDSQEYETLMFEKYINYIDYETEKQKIHSVISAIFTSVSVLILLGVPMILDMFKGIDIIFTQH